MVRAMLMGSWASRTGDKKFVRFMAHVYHKDVVLLKDLLEAGKVTPVLDKHYPLSQVADAMRYFGDEHARGKIIITVG
jgi:NADPH:quinone reductase-like Zn-dependent oxidoreductase